MESVAALVDALLRSPAPASWTPDRPGTGEHPPGTNRARRASMCRRLCTGAAAWRPEVECGGRGRRERERPRCACGRGGVLRARTRGRSRRDRPLARLRRAIGVPWSWRLCWLRRSTPCSRRGCCAGRAPTLRVTPADGIVDGGTVRATGRVSRLRPSRPVRRGSPRHRRLRLDDGHGRSSSVRAARSRSIIRVFALIHTETRGAIDCRVGGRLRAVGLVVLGGRPA